MIANHHYLGLIAATVVKLRLQVTVKIRLVKSKVVIAELMFAFSCCLME